MLSSISRALAGVLCFTVLIFFLSHDSAAQCTTMSMNMFDSFGDGWNGATYTINEVGSGSPVFIASGNLDFADSGDGSSFGTDILCLVDGCYTITVGGGSWDGEITWNLTNTSTGTISGAAPATVSFEVGSGCILTPPSGCSGQSTDNGGAFGNYGNSQNTTTTYCPDNAGDCVVMSFSSFSLENNWDFLSIYDGPSAASPLIGTYTGTASPGDIVASNGCLTLVFTSDGSVTAAGWVAELSCISCSANPFGCTDPNAENYDPAAVFDDGSCTYTLTGVGCPEITLGADIALPECFDPCSPISVSADYFEVGEPTTYTTQSIPYAPPFPTNTGTPFSINVDDVYTNAITLPFDFCFYGNTYNQCVIGSNGVISFDMANAGGFCPWQFTETVPDPLLPRNAVFGVYHDIDPSVCGDARYAILGTAPCRVFVVNFDNVCHFSCNSMISSSQIVLYETTNTIEVYVGNKPTCTGWNSGNAVIGLQNQAGTAGIVAPGRQTGPWSTSNEAWRFTPAGPSIVSIDWFSQTNGYIGSGATVDVCPSEATESFVAQATYTLCDGTSITVSDDIVVTCAQVFLPVEWLGFQAELISAGQEVLCTWQTATELNSDYFTVERSADGFIWEDIGTMNGAGTTTIPQAYEWVDRNPLPGQSYYRIRQTDFNGEEDHSTKRPIVRPYHQLSFSVYPNPGTGLFTVDGWAKETQLRVLDMRGREIEYTRVGERQIDVRHAAAGQYIFELQLGQAIEPRRQLVQLYH